MTNSASNFRSGAHPAVELADCLILAIARKGGHLPLVTFGRKLAKIDGVASLK